MAPRALQMLACFSNAAANVPVPAKENARGDEKRRGWTGAIKRKILAAARRPRIRAVTEEPLDVNVVEQGTSAPEPKVPEQLQATPRRVDAPVLQSGGSPSHDGAPEVVAVAANGRRKRKDNGRRKRRGHRVRFDLPPAEISAGPVAPHVEKQRAPAPVPEPKVPEQLQVTPRREGAPTVLQSDNDGAPEAVAVAANGRRKKKGLRVRFDLRPVEIIAAPVEPQFPTGVLGEPPESFSHSGGTEMTAAFLMSVIAKKSGGPDSAPTRIDGDLVARWAERKAACSRRLSYLRDYCPFQREEEEVEDKEGEESEPETLTRPEAEPDHAAEVRPVKTVLPPFDSPESEAEFVKAIRSRYLHKDEFLSRCAYERSCEQQSLVAAGEGPNVVQQLKV